MKTQFPKKLTFILIVILLAVIGVISIFINVMKSKQTNYDTAVFTSLKLSDIQDGIYTGREDGGIVKASVEVLVEDHAIKNVKILSHECGTGKKAEVIVDEIVETNSLTVDAVSGATYSSNVIKMAIYNALMQEQKKQTN